MNEYPLVFQLLVLYVFFLPLLSVQIPGVIAGFSINPARLMIVCSFGLAVAARCLHPSEQWKALPKEYRNATLGMWLAYLVVSVVYYYTLLSFGSGLRFGEMESFFRSWRGRPIGQLISLVTYGVVAYLLIRHYGRRSNMWRAIEGALIAAVVVLVVYGFAQQISFYLGFPVTGRLLYEGAGLGMRQPTYSVGGTVLLRFYSLGGEPRDYGVFAIGAIPFCASWALGRRDRRSAVLLAALGLSLLLTLSTSAVVALMLVAAVVVVDATIQGFIRVGTVARVATGVALIAGVLVVTNAGSLLGERTLAYIDAARTLGTQSREYAYLLRAQASDFGAVFYLLDLRELPLHRLLFGFGFGNYSSGMADIFLRYFDYDVVREGALDESRAFIIKMLVETGIVGVALLIALFVRTLRRSGRLIDAAANRQSRKRQIALRYAYVAFFIAGMVQTSFYHFIIMGLIDAQGRSRFPTPNQQV